MTMMMNNFEFLSEGLSNVKVQRRRDAEARRRERLFDDKLRSIGVDKEFLDKQVAEKMARKKAEKEEQGAHDAAMLDNIEHASLLHTQQLKVKHDMEKAIVDYRRQYQQPHGGKELDAKAQMMMLPGLLGEDPDSRRRAQRQREQLQRWLIQQQDEKGAEKHRQKMEKLQDDRRRIDMDNEALQRLNKEQERRKTAAIATQEWNRNTMIKTKERHLQERNQDIQQIDRHTGVMGAPGLNPSIDRKPPPDSSTQISQFYKHQIEEKMRAELEKKREEMRHDGIRLDSARTAVLLERQRARHRKQLRRHVDTSNKELAAAQHRKEDIGRGHIDERYFSQFNTSSR
ncbi:RIB43A-like with coiled-coils protein 2 [Hippocampus zosterae]|uniref:RIB43A-like with coiled-coils protein 2 n=1 Tax=Hippocampus zosterae TaxID=109293 RepID=UPI00223DED9F|nr:RIB43A-like with coiled-coils protein 2 [Hippocampus zosterae]